MSNKKKTVKIHRIEAGPRRAERLARIKSLGHKAPASQKYI